MSTERKSSIPNPEWERNKQENIKTARKLFGLLLDGPAPTLPFAEKLECISMSREFSSADGKRIFIEGSKETEGSYGPYGIIPASFRLPLFGITLRTDDKLNSLNQSSKFGELPTHVIASNGQYCVILNNYAFNLSGQGVRVELIIPHSLPLESYFWKEGVLEARERLRQLDFVPKESDSRVEPLSHGDYTKVFQMLGDIDAGLYKHPQ